MVTRHIESSIRNGILQILVKFVSVSTIIENRFATLENNKKGILIPADVTGVHKMFQFARSKPNWCTELGKAFTTVG